jgi:hypothetical protein
MESVDFATQYSFMFEIHDYEFIVKDFKHI